MRRFLPVECIAPTGGLIRSTLTYASTIDPSIANLTADVVLADGGADLPILVLMHGYAETKSALDASVRDRFARAGFCVVVPDMRGRSGAGGTKDASGREPHDVIDALAVVRAAYPSASRRRAGVDGYSGGGGTALALLAKAPSRWSFVVSNFGPSDYGFHPADSWYFTNPAFQASLTADVGASPSAQPAWWRARDHVSAIPRVLRAARGAVRAPLLHLFHDEADAAVSVRQSEALVAACAELGVDDLLAFHRSTASDPADVRYLHGYPSQVPGLLAAEALWVPRALRARAWTLPAEGELHVAGWLLGDGWAVWLGEVGQDPKTGANGGRASAALVRWTSSGSFSLRPAAGGMSYRIERGASVATGETYDEVTVSL